MSKFRTIADRKARRHKMRGQHHHGQLCDLRPVDMRVPLEVLPAWRDQWKQLREVTP